MQTTSRNNYSFLIGREIRERRKTIGMTQMELAEKSNLSTVYIGRVERGQDTITISNLNRICQALNTSLYSLFKNIEQPCYTDRERLTTYIEKNIASLTEKELIFISKFIQFLNTAKPDDLI